MQGPGPVRNFAEDDPVGGIILTVRRCEPSLLADPEQLLEEVAVVPARAPLATDRPWGRAEAVCSGSPSSAPIRPPGPDSRSGAASGLGARQRFMPGRPTGFSPLSAVVM
ncbi:hypothetical protein GCM10025880_26380 [Methylorubrum aminovorans]|nr:hypothetical protein GCM10025880_26380 [Methylorubrum aminovorans]